MEGGGAIEVHGAGGEIAAAARCSGEAHRAGAGASRFLSGAERRRVPPRRDRDRTHKSQFARAVQRAEVKMEWTPCPRSARLAQAWAEYTSPSSRCSV